MRERDRQKEREREREYVRTKGGDDEGEEGRGGGLIDKANKPG